MKKPEVFFIRGFDRSGTHWLEDLVNLHPDINCQGPFNLDIFFSGLKNFEKSNSCINTDGKPGYFNFLKKSIQIFTKEQIIKFCGTDYKLVGDCSAKAIGTQFIPRSKYIVVARDGRDVIVDKILHIIKSGAQSQDNIKLFKRIPSLQKKIELYRNDRDYFGKNKKELLNDKRLFLFIALMWKNHILSDYSIYQNHSLHQSRILWIQLEELQSDLENYLKSIYEFLNVDSTKGKTVDEFTLGSLQLLQPQGVWKEYFSEENLEWYDNNTQEAQKVVKFFTNSLEKKV